MKLFNENFKVVEALTPQTNGGDLAGDYISLKNYNHCTVLVHIAQGNAATAAITIEQATKVDGTGSKALAKNVPIFVNSDCAAGDTLTREASDGVAYTTSAAVKHKLVAFEINTADLDVAGGFDCICVKVATSHADNIVGATYILSGARYGVGKSAIVD